MIYGNVENEDTTYAVVTLCVSGPASSTSFASVLDKHTAVDAMFVEFQQTCEEVQSNGFRTAGGISSSVINKGSEVEVAISQAFERVPRCPPQLHEYSE